MGHLAFSRQRIRSSALTKRAYPGMFVAVGAVSNRAHKGTPVVRARLSPNRSESGDSELQRKLACNFFHITR